MKKTRLVVISLSLSLTVLLNQGIAVAKVKHKSEWKTLVPIARKKGLDEVQILFLLALREVENGSKGNEFGVKAAKGTDLIEQSLWAIGSILKNEARWQDYIRSQSYIDFVKFFGWYGGPYGRGWCPVNDDGCEHWVDTMRLMIKEVEKEINNES